jgi:hypothetical protein
MKQNLTDPALTRPSTQPEPPPPERRALIHLLLRAGMNPALLDKVWPHEAPRQPPPAPRGG